MKTPYLASVAVVLAGLAATANVSPARAGDEEDALKYCVFGGLGLGPIFWAGCVAGYAIETADDEEEEEDDARPFPSTGRQVHVPLTATPKQQQTAVPPKRTTPFRPKVKVGLTAIDSAGLPKPTSRNRVTAKKIPQLGLAQPAAAMKTFTAAPRAGKTQKIP